MAIHVGEVVESTGFQRRTNKGAERMLFDNLQKGQYVYPVKSTIRELVSNGIDSINEKEIARKILTGEAKEEDFYYVPGTNLVLDAAMEANPGEYENSRFDASYYDLKYLDFESNRVLIKYIESDNTQRDKVQIIDHGVALSPRRLEGILELGYSTKRLAKSPLGKFGLGAKVALSTQVDFYTVNTVYNGKRTSFNVYNHTATCNIPPFDADGKNEIAYFSYDVEKKYPYYWKKSEERNNVVIEFEIKKHRKQELISAVKSQLLYFPNVDLQIVKPDGYVTNEQVQADIIYEDDKIIISNNNQFSKPHIVINNVSYGYIDFLELETEEKRGNIGVKYQPHQIDVSPSRESVMWTEKTGSAIRTGFKDVEDIAAAYITKSINETNFMLWWSKSKAIAGAASSSDRVIEAFREIIDISTIKPTFELPSGKKMQYGSMQYMAPFITFIKVTKSTVYKGGQDTLKINREPWPSFEEGMPVYVKTHGESYKFHTDLYLLNEVHPDGFYTITYHEKENFKELKTGDEVWDDKRKEDHEINKEQSLFIAKEIAAFTQKDRYENISSPAKYKELEKGKDKESEEDEVKVSNEDKRKLNGTIPSKLLGLPYYSGMLPSKDGVSQYFEHKQEELSLADIRQLSDSDQETYYGTSKDNEMLHLVATIVRPCEKHWSPGYGDSKFWFWNDNSPLRLLEVSQDNQRKHGHSWNHVTTFFKRFNPSTGIISMSQHLINWNTARLINQHINKMKFLNNFQLFDKEAADQYQKLKEFHSKHWRSFSDLFNGNYGSREEIQTELVKYLENLAELQMFAASAPEDGEITDKVREMFPDENNPEQVKGANAVDLDILDTLNQLLDFTEPFRILLNSCSDLVEEGSTITPDLEQEIRGFIAYKTGN